LRFSKCFWAQKHPGEAVPLQKVTSDDINAGDTTGDGYVHGENEPEDATTTTTAEVSA
jgi:peptide/nickel transport system ATP-binding protein